MKYGDRFITRECLYCDWRYTAEWYQDEPMRSYHDLAEEAESELTAHHYDRHPGLDLVL